MKGTFEENTNEFYKELNSNCDPDKLLEIAKHGIYLYEPLFKYEKIKNHVNVIEISILANQFFMINNDNQYNKLIYIYTNRCKSKLYKNNEEYIFNLIIMNKYIIDKILMNENEGVVYRLCNKLGLNVIIKSLYKYSYIDINLFNLFSKIVYNRDHPTFKFEISEFFYNNKMLLGQTLKSNIIANYLLTEIIRKNCITLSLLEYITENIDVSIIKHNPCYNFKLLMPFNIIKKYKNKLLGPNTLYVKCNDKFSEEFINIMFSDHLIDLIFNKHEKNYENYYIFKHYKKH